MTSLNSPPAKRRKISSQLGNTKSKDPSHNDELESPLRSLRRSITPPPSNRATPQHDARILPSTASVVKGKVEASSDQTQPKTKFIRSPFRLTHIRDLDDESNADTIALDDILRDPMIKECWQFNFLFDIDFIMSVFPPRLLFPINRHDNTGKHSTLTSETLCKSRSFTASGRTTIHGDACLK